MPAPTVVVPALLTSIWLLSSLPLFHGCNGNGGSVEDSAGFPAEAGGEGRCGAVDQASNDGQARSGEVELGGFTVGFLEPGLRIGHPTAPAGVLLEANRDDWLGAWVACLSVSERQGSFAPGEQLEVGCQSAVWDDHLLQDGQLRARGYFSDARAECRSLSFELLLQPEGEGRLGISFSFSDPRFNFVRMAFASAADERIYGMGEQFPWASLDLKGRAIPVLAQEGGIGRGEPVVTPAAELLSPGSGGSEHTTYLPMPCFLTNRNRGFLLENTDYSVFDFSAPDLVAVTVHSAILNGQLLAAGAPLELVERLTEVTGRMAEPPEWLDRGAVVALARPVSEVAEVVELLRDSGAELSAVWNQTWSGMAKSFVGEQVVWNWVLDELRHPSWQEVVSGLEEEGIRTLCYVNPMFRDLGEALPAGRRNLFAEGAEKGFFVKRQDGTIYMLTATAFEVALLDLSNPAARNWMKAVLLDELVKKAHCAGWMVDFAEALPFDARLDSGESAASWHNRYPVEWARLSREVAAELGEPADLLVFNRSGHLATPGAAMMIWEGDQLTTWDDYDGLGSALRGLIGSGFSGIALNHSDTGGYTSLAVVGAGYVRSPELLCRWAEMNAFTALFRTHEGNQPAANAQVYGDQATRLHFARMTRVYKALAPYRRQLYREAAERGWPVVRHLAMHYPEDAESWAIDDQFLLGADFLVAPVHTPCGEAPDCAVTVSVYFPPGLWVHLWSGAQFGNPDLGVRASLSAPLGEPPVFYQKDSTVGAALRRELQLRGR